MPVTNPQIKNLLNWIDLEEKEQVQRYSLDQQHSLKSLKAEGLALHPISVTRRNFGYADYPEISFRLNYINGKSKCPIFIFQMSNFLTNISLSSHFTSLINHGHYSLYSRFKWLAVHCLAFNYLPVRFTVH